jgi:hypothetical protein
MNLTFEDAYKLQEKQKIRDTSNLSKIVSEDISTKIKPEKIDITDLKIFESTHKKIKQNRINSLDIFA